MEQKEIRTILIPFDFTPLSDCALQHGIQFSKMLGTDIYLLHVIENNANEKYLTERLNTLASDTFNTYNVRPKVLFREGKVADTIKSVANEINAMLVIMKTDGGPKGIKRFFGSLAIKVMMGSEVPFIVVQGPPIRYSLKKVVVPIDFRSENKEKLSWISFLTKFYHPEIHLYYPNKSDYRVRNNLKFAAKFLEGRNIKFELEHATGKADFNDEAIEFSRSIRADLILIVLRKFITWDKILLGLNEQQYISNKYHIPVMVLNPKANLNRLGSFA